MFNRKNNKENQIMKKTIGIALALLCGGAVVFADNLVKNGEFRKKSSAWSVTGGGKVTFSADGAPEGGFVRIEKSADAEKKSVTVRQNMTAVLSPNTAYKVSAKVRGVDFKAKNYGLIFINEGWSKQTGILKFPVTGEWTKIEAAVKTPDFKKSVTFMIYAADVSGALEVADIEVEPVADETGAPAA